MGKKTLNVALIGNPNTGKTSVFNALTGLNQQVGNYPGITVEKKMGFCKLTDKVKANILDLPGTYSLNASSMDENVVIELMLNRKDPLFPDVAVVVTDVENLKRNLLLFTQIKDLEIPTLLVINMVDRMRRKGIQLDVPYLEQQLNTRIVLVSTREHKGIDELKAAMLEYEQLSTAPCLNASSIDPDYFNQLRNTYPNQQLYKLWLLITQDVNFSGLQRNEIEGSFRKPNTELKRLQQLETIKRYQFINEVLKQGCRIDPALATGWQARLDRWVVHKVYGYAIFLGILFIMFQAIFDWSSVPMDFIDTQFAHLASWLSHRLPAGELSQLLCDGVVPGIGGIVIFIPQIAFLFLFISILEESGYMSRVVFLMDRLMRPFGLSGKSVVPLISGAACAIPAIMGTRNIESWRERLITILVTPFITCSARLPVYAILIALIIPDQRLFGLFSQQGLTLMSLYLLGFGMALLSAFVLHRSMPRTHKSYFVVEMPAYKVPLLRNVALNVVEKTRSFVLGAGKIILALSVILWYLGAHGSSKAFEGAEHEVRRIYGARFEHMTPAQQVDLVQSFQLEHSYIGTLGKTLEPAIRPLGYDWKIGVALISSFTAREVFVGTLATLYSVGSHSEEEGTIKARMGKEVYADTGQKVFTLPTGVSLLVFYALAMQCISTLAVVKKETLSWKWPLIQLFCMTGLALLGAWLSFQLLS